MKITAIIGSARKKHTYNAVMKFFKSLQSQSREIFIFEIIRLSRYNLEPCRGCTICFNKGEEHCPLQDDMDKLIDKIIQSDGVVLASPNYSFHVSGLMKIFIDRLGYLFHRPCFFGKTFTSIVAEGIYGGKDIVKYFNLIGKALGCTVVNGSCITTLEPLTEKIKNKNSEILNRHSSKFYSHLKEKSYPAPSLFDVMMFRISRNKIKNMLDETFRDYNYYNEKGWFKSDYFYPVSLSAIHKLTGKFFDLIA